ncbi:MAG: stage sporulation protein [Candidatus Dependentiae bacterium]|nr:stage sporulation protein [Candidatus Dependentiae bacterium]
MEITEVKIYPVSLGGRLRAYVSLTFDNSFIVREVKLVESALGLFVSMPSRRKKDGTFKDIAHPLNNEMRQIIERKVLEAYHIAKNSGFAERDEGEAEELNEIVAEEIKKSHPLIEENKKR